MNYDQGSSGRLKTFIQTGFQSTVERTANQSYTHNEINDKMDAVHKQKGSI